MTVETPKTTTTVPPASSHGCCGGEAATEARSKASKPTAPAAVERSEPSKTAESGCCGGAGKK